MSNHSSQIKPPVVTKADDPCQPSLEDLYPCEECSQNGTHKYFISQAKLTVHRKQCHSSNSFTCNICFKVFRENCKLNRHKRSVHSGAEKISCSICHKTYSIRSSLQEHLFTAHKLKTGKWNYSKCDICSKEFANKSRLETHVVENHVVDKEFQCSVCSKKFIDHQSLEKHKKKVHPSIIRTTVHACDVCSKEFTSRPHLKPHFKNFHPERTYCTKCVRSFIHKSDFNQHLETNHENNGAFECPICHLVCTSQCSFDCHTESHIKKLKSDAAAPSDESQGMRLGEEEVGFNCELCSEIFDTESNFFSHRRSIHQIRTTKYKCFYKNCSKTFRSAVSLRRHKLIHQQMEPCHMQPSQ